MRHLEYDIKLATTIKVFRELRRQKQFVIAKALGMTQATYCKIEKGEIAITPGILSTSPIINSLKVYPNPASTLLHIDLEKPGYFTAKLSSITGQSIITPTSGTIDVSALANGVYILTIYDSNNKLISTNKVAIVK